MSWTSATPTKAKPKTPWTQGQVSGDAPKHGFLGTNEPVLDPVSADFYRDPLGFARRYMLRPPSGKLGQKVSSQFADASNFDFIAGNNGPEYGVGAQVDLRLVSDPIQFISLKPSVYNNSYTFDLGVTARKRGMKTGVFPIYFLPWGSLQIGKLTIPPVTGLADPDEDEHPRIFFTAALSGCSVYVTGSITNPTVWHAGISDGRIKGDAHAFWTRMLLRWTKGPTSSGEIKGELSKNEYMRRDRKIVDFLDWTNASGTAPMHIERVDGAGCVFGVRFGSHWSFYMQETQVITRTTLVKKPAPPKPTGVRGVIARVEQRLGRGDDAGDVAVTPTNSVTYALPVRVAEIFPRRFYNEEPKHDIKLIAG